MGNTTIHANITSEGEVTGILQQLGVSPAGGSGGNSGGQAAGASTPTRGSTPSANSLMPKTSEGGWGDSGGAGAPVATSASGGASAAGGGGPLFTGGGVWGAPESNALHPLLPGDLL